jgi:hypothetical protein
MRSAKQWARVICRELGTEDREVAESLAQRVRDDALEAVANVVDAIAAKKQERRDMMVSGSTYCCLPNVEEWRDLAAVIRSVMDPSPTVRQPDPPPRNAK